MHNFTLVQPTQPQLVWWFKTIVIRIGKQNTIAFHHFNNILIVFPCQITQTILFVFVEVAFEFRVDFLLPMEVTRFTIKRYSTTKQKTYLRSSFVDLLPDFKVFYVIGTVVNGFICHVGCVNYNNDVSRKPVCCCRD